MIITKKIAAVLLLFTMSLSACDSTDSTPKKRPAIPAHVVETASISTVAMSHKLSISGSLEAIQLMRLYSEEDGRITELPLYVGDNAKKNDIIIKLDDRLARAELTKSTALRTQAKVDLQRLKTLRPKNLASEEDVVRATTAYDVASAEENLQRIRFNQTQIKAPFDGIVTQRNNEPGDVVAVNSHIMTIINPHRLRLKAYISERWISQIDIDSEVEVSIDTLGNTTYPAKISRIYPTIDPLSRKGALEIELNPAPEGALPGQLGRAQLSTRQSERRVVPSIAIHHDIDGPYIFVVDKESKVEKRMIKKGLEYEGFIEVLANAETGEEVVVKGFLGLNHGKKVKTGNAQ